MGQAWGKIKVGLECLVDTCYVNNFGRTVALKAGTECLGFTPKYPLASAQVALKAGLEVVRQTLQDQCIGNVNRKNKQQQKQQGKKHAHANYDFARNNRIEMAPHAAKFHHTLGMTGKKIHSQLGQMMGKRTGIMLWGREKIRQFIEVIGMHRNVYAPHIEANEMRRNVYAPHMIINTQLGQMMGKRNGIMLWGGKKTTQLIEANEMHRNALALALAPARTHAQKRIRIRT
jgi:hypothetical protein